MKITRTALSGLVRVEAQPIEDVRGNFMRVFCESELRSLLGNRRVVQVNQSITRLPGTVRGLHYQHPPHAEMKIVRCLHGCVWDVAVDLRAKSPTFLHWHAEELSARNHRALVIPEGFAHGFQVLEPDSMLLYLHTVAHAPDAEGGIRPTDPLLGIRWPMEVEMLSARDESHALLQNSFAGVQP